MGLAYVPSFGVLAHHFKERLTLAMGIVASGSCIGGVVHPIMLNRLFADPSVGFAKGVRASAGMNLGVLAIGCALIRTRLPPKKALGASSLVTSMKRFAKDKVYVCAVLG